MAKNDPPSGMKLFPRNLTARAAYVVPGNPVVSRPESGADNAHPGLEFDQRNLDRVFFPGLLFDYQFGAGARLAGVRAPWADKMDGDGRRCLDAAEGEFFLWYVYGKFGDRPGDFQLADLYGLDGYDVLRKVHDLEPGPLIVAIGRRPDQLSLDNVPAWLGSVRELMAGVASGNLEPQIRTFRDHAGAFQFAVVVGARADYLDKQGVIDLQSLEPGALTRSLCSPWQWDFTDCGCYYWAASRPDIVTDAEGTKGLNFLREDRASPPLPAADMVEWSKWMSPSRTMTAPRMILRWETLPIVIDDQETDRYKRVKVTGLWNLWDRDEVIKWLRELASVEHALAVKFLFAYYSVNAPVVTPHEPITATDSDLTKVAKEIFQIAIDEMRHFRWINEALLMLGAPPNLDRAKELKKPPGRDGFAQASMPLPLEALTPEAVARFVEIEKPSQQYTIDEVAGLYTHILVSLEQHPEREKQYTPEVRERLQEICKLIMDEGGDHWRRALRVQDLLKDKKPEDYLVYTGPSAPEPPGSQDRLLQDLGDQYYHLMLDVLGMAFRPPESVRGHTLRQARRVMYNLHEVGRLLGRRKKSLLFTMPGASSGDAPSGGVSTALGVSIPGLLVSLGSFASADMVEVAKRHAQTVAELNLEDDGEEQDA
jgi:bacterioferritin (cytochrome b1)